METLRKFLQSLRVFKRLRLAEMENAQMQSELRALGFFRRDVEEYFASREPCGACGHHRYRQKTLHRCNVA